MTRIVSLRVCSIASERALPGAKAQTGALLLGCLAPRNASWFDQPTARKYRTTGTPKQQEHGVVAIRRIERGWKIAPRTAKRELSAPSDTAGGGHVEFLPANEPHVQVGLSRPCRPTLTSTIIIDFMVATWIATAPALGDRLNLRRGYDHFNGHQSACITATAHGDCEAATRRQ